MKLNTRQTVRIGLAFFSICAFWQLYNGVIPLILTGTFHLDETLSGAVMAADNVLGLFLLPFFGALSDRCRWRMGRRTPFLLLGTAAASALMLALPVLDNSFFAAPARWKLLAFFLVLGALLVAMSACRSPAVALMPDLTPRPLRSQANAIINLMGALGAIAYLLTARILYFFSRDGHADYFPLFAAVSALMLTCAAAVALSVPERRMAEEVRLRDAALLDQPEAPAGPLPPPVRRSLFLLLVSIGLWFVGYNAVETWFTAYANRVWGMSLGSAAVCLAVASCGAIVSYLPAGAAAARLGRRRVILWGIALLTACFFALFLYTLGFESFSPALYIVFALIGLAWAAISVNSLPMVVELCHGSDVGRFTGYYYVFSMAAQTVTPIAAGALLRHVGYVTLFPYAAAAVACSFVTMLAVRHGEGASTDSGKQN